LACLEGGVESGDEGVSHRLERLEMERGRLRLKRRGRVKGEAEAEEAEEAVVRSACRSRMHLGVKLRCTATPLRSCLSAYCLCSKQAPVALRWWCARCTRA
jgi:hypothetical protein